VLETTRYEGRQRVRGSLALALLLGVFSLLIIYIFPSIAESAADIDAMIDALPESFREGFGAETYTTIEGFVAAELYQFVWVLLLGLYMAYRAGGTVADDVESGRLHLVLATPIARTQLVLEKFLALFVPIGVLSLVVPLFVFGGSLAIDYPLDPFYLVAVHVLTLPYLLVCAGIGLLLSVLFDRGDVAQRGGIAVIFLLFLLDSVTAGTDVDWLGAVSPTRYVDPTDILLHETLDLGDPVLLLGVALGLVFLSVVAFADRDI
jgi:ABC-2 type transport system permease protein